MMSQNGKTFIVYMATNAVNGKRYVGATSRGLDERRYQHYLSAKRHKKGCRIFNAAIRKYGEGAFNWEIILTVENAQELMREEIRLIALHRPEYNITRGGLGIVGAIRTPEWLANMSKGLMGRTSPSYWLGKRQDQSVIDRMKQTKKTNHELTKYVGVLTQKRLHEFLSYDSLTGEFRWKQSNNQAHIGDVAGHVQKSGHVRIVLDGRKYLAHVLAWFYVHGEWPRSGLIHKNRNLSDNKLENIQPATKSKISGVRSVGTNNVLGIKGVRQHEGGKYIARIMCNGRSYYLGLFDKLEDAVKAREAKAKKLFGELAEAA